MRWIRLAFISLFCFLFITSGAFFKKSIALFLCSVFTLNALTCSTWISDESRAIAISPLSSNAGDDSRLKAKSSSVSTKIGEPNSEEIAQLRIPNLQIPDIRLPGGRSVEDVLKGAVADQLIKALGNLIEDEAPISFNPQDIYPTVNQLPGGAFQPTPLSQNQGADGILTALLSNKTSQADVLIGQLPRVRMQNRQPNGSETLPVEPVQEGSYPFNPTGNTSQVVAQLQSSSDGSVMLSPGDYSIPMTLYCMRQRASSPAGHRYLLAPLKGSRASVIFTLNARAAGKEIPTRELQTLSWNIQAGIDYEDMSTESQALVNQLIPEQRQKLSRDFLEQVEATYSQIAGVAGLPSLNSLLDELGEVGEVIRGYQQFRETLIRYRNDYNALVQELIPSGSSSMTGGEDNTPWSQLNDRTYARMVTEGRVGDTGYLQIRVLPSANGADSSAVKVGVTSIVADSQNDSVQPLTGAPEPSVGPSPMCDVVGGSTTPISALSVDEIAARKNLLDISKLQTENKQQSNRNTLPSFEELVKNYPSGEPEDVKRLIGGRVDANWINNTCAIRMSRALNYSSGLNEIPFSRNQTISGEDKKWYFYRVKDFIEYMKNTFGRPDITLSRGASGSLDLTQLNDKKGVIVLEIPFSDATGHATLWNGSDCVDVCRTPHLGHEQSYLDMATGVKLWISAPSQITTP